MKKLPILWILILALSFGCKNDPAIIPPTIAEPSSTVDSVSILKGFILESPKLGEHLQTPDVVVRWRELEDSPHNFKVLLSHDSTFREVDITAYPRGSNMVNLGVLNPGGIYFLRIQRGRDRLSSRFSVEEVVTWSKMTYRDTLFVKDHHSGGGASDRGSYIETLEIIRKGAIFGIKFGRETTVFNFDQMRRLDTLGTLQFTNHVDFNQADYFGAGLTLFPENDSISAYYSTGDKITRTARTFNSK